MLESSLELLKKMESNGFEAYIVGGFVRDYIIGNSSLDVDICTNATPKEIKKIFPKTFMVNEYYGSIVVLFNKIRFEITTFRKEFNYTDYRRPSEVVYVDSLEEDIKRRDFTINTLCINSKGEIIDLLGAKKDIDARIIKTVGNSYRKFSEDALRILRAIRFATVLNFSLDQECIDAIIKTKGNLRNISYDRKKLELDKIFTSPNAKYGIELIISLGIDVELEIYNMENIILSSDLLGVWSSINVSEKYPFSKSEREILNSIRYLESVDNMDSKILYKYGPYLNSIAAFNKGIDKNEIVRKFNFLPIKSRSDILISSEEIMNILNRKSGKYINDIYCDIEEKILRGELFNDNKILKEFVYSNYGGD